MMCLRKNTACFSFLYLVKSGNWLGPTPSHTSYDNYWSYYYYDLGSYSSSYYFTDVSQFPSVGFKGYVTGDNGPWSPANDSFATLGSEDGHNIHIFTTYIMSSVDQNVIFAAGGNDGHTIFIDDTYTTDTVTIGSTSYGAGAGYNVTAARSLEMAANVSYKITLACKCFP
ncbi:hypothetical protein UWK_02844 [Desulfocapsa sulfexigens DSM 10523]|uniref:Uncharacterized protein n=1 Tax=Desulfocapsa sulfexigens (strain DSM 10523 / SB164P1) TaxID=1167006 RepID=M1PIF4_DESSD|nr:hypothetical protein UWK_02844 [Desulfocapsa sulfexigens DSM 10523]